MLIIWTIHVIYLDDWGYISGGFALRINMIVMFELKYQWDISHKQ